MKSPGGDKKGLHPAVLFYVNSISFREQGFLFHEAIAAAYAAAENEPRESPPSLTSGCISAVIVLVTPPDT